MSSRTRDLPPLSGVAHLLREIRYHEASRQGLGLGLIVLFALAAQPQAVLFRIGAAVALAGMLVRLYASGFIFKNRQLATSGPYSLVRHPLYTGNLLLMIGFTLASGVWWAVPVSAVFWWLYYPTAIEYEDRKLHRIFGEEWERWARTVPAVIPSRLIPRGGRWSFMTSLKQNAEPAVVVFVLFWLWYIGRSLF